MKYLNIGNSYTRKIKQLGEGGGGASLCCFVSLSATSYKGNFNSRAIFIADVKVKLVTNKHCHALGHIVSHTCLFVLHPVSEEFPLLKNTLHSLSPFGLWHKQFFISSEAVRVLWCSNIVMTQRLCYAIILQWNLVLKKEFKMSNAKTFIKIIPLNALVDGKSVEKKSWKL